MVSPQLELREQLKQVRADVLAKQAEFSAHILELEVSNAGHAKNLHGAQTVQQQCMEASASLVSQNEGAPPQP